MYRTTQDQFHKVVLHGKTIIFIITAIVAMVVEGERGSTFHEICVETEVQESCMKLTMLHGAMPTKTCFTALLHITLG